ncbi:MAG: VWA domain-containing protein [Planctomycetota bacterium]
MRISYLEFDREEAMRRMSRRDLNKIWNQLLMMTGGDVDEALKILERIWRRHNLFDGEYTFEQFRDDLMQQGLIRRAADGDGEGEGEGDVERPIGDFKLTSRGERAIRESALDQIFGSLRSAGDGDHRTPRAGTGGDALSETRPFQPGDLSSDIDYTRSLTNSLRRSGIDEMDLHESDLEVYEKEHMASCATVLMIDISHSMILYGEDRITPARRVAIAMAELIQRKYPKDSLDVIAFGNEATRIEVKDLPYLQVGPYYTNTRAALQLAQRLLARKRQANKQIFMITDGKPSVIHENGQLYRNSFGLDPKIVNVTLQEAAACRRKRIGISTFMIAQDPVLVQFVDQLTKINKGRAYYSSLDNLGGYVFVDYIRNRRRRVR